MNVFMYFGGNGAYFRHSFRCHLFFLLYFIFYIVSIKLQKMLKNVCDMLLFYSLPCAWKLNIFSLQ